MQYFFFQLNSQAVELIDGQRFVYMNLGVRHNGCGLMRARK